jgi:alpha-ketoglutarate-dependent 2,4-dichlorophenoxyacetate dioxygenase
MPAFAGKTRRSGGKAMIATVPLAEGFGVELVDAKLLDVASSDAAYRAVRALFEEHSLLLFRDQSVTDDVQAAFSRAFGPLELVKVGSVGHGTFYSRLNNLDAEGRIVPENHRQVWRARANQLWHTDSSFKKTPALASVLSARHLPGSGGETEFTSTRRAWAALSPARQARLENAIVTHSYANSRDQIHPELMTAEERAALPPVRWRMTWRNPVNDRRALYIASHAYAVDGMGDNEAKALLASLIAEATAPGKTYLHRWRPGDVVMWDNRATMHRGRPWPLNEARNMVRTTIQARDEDGVAELRPAA